MKTFKILFAFILLAGFTFSCTPTSITEDETSNSIDVVATGGDDSTTVDETKD